MISYMVELLFGSLSELSGFGAPTDDDMVDRVNHVMTFTLILLCAVLVTTFQFLGKAIVCVDDTHKYESSQLDYVDALCWVKNTHDDTLQPGNAESRGEVLYYQWVPLILIAMAASFKAPSLLWRLLNRATGLNIEKVASMAESTQCMDPDTKDQCVRDIAHCLDRWLLHGRSYNTWSFRSLRQELGRAGLLLCCLGRRSGTFLCGLYVFCKLLYLANTAALLLLLQLVLGFNPRDVVEIALTKDHDLLHEQNRSLAYRLERFFPRQTQCHFQIRQLANTPAYTFQCLLPINVVSEKIFIMVWLWLCVLGVVNAYSLLLWFYRIALRRDRANTVAKYLQGLIQSPDDRADYREFLTYYLRDDGVFVLRLISDNSHSLILLELLPLLWKTYQDRIKARSDRAKKEEEEGGREEEEDDRRGQNGGCKQRRPHGSEPVPGDVDLGEGIPLTSMNSSFRYRKVPL